MMQSGLGALAEAHASSNMVLHTMFEGIPMPNCGWEAGFAAAHSGQAIGQLSREQVVKPEPQQDQPHQGLHLKTDSGVFGSELKVGVIPEGKNSKNWSYVSGITCTNQEMLYCKKDVVVPFHVQCGMEPSDLIMEVRVEFSDPEIRQQPVLKCANHREADKSERSLDYRSCFLRKGPMIERVAEYRLARHNSIILPLKDACKTLDLACTCLSSCVSIKKPIQLVFSIVRCDSDAPPVTLSEYVLCLKVCANPCRDALRDKIRFQQDEYNNNLYLRMPMSLKRKGGSGPVESATKQRISSNDMFDEREDDISLPSAASKVVMVDLNLTVSTQEARRILNGLYRRTTEERAQFQRKAACGLGADPYKAIGTLSRNTSVRSWLTLPNLNMARFVELFSQHGINTLGDMLDKHNTKFFASLGIPSEECDVLNRYYANWANVEKVKAMKEELNEA